MLNVSLLSKFNFVAEFDCLPADLYRGQGPFPVPCEHDYFSFESFGLAPVFYCFYCGLCALPSPSARDMMSSAKA